MLIGVKNIVKKYFQGEQLVTALFGVSYEFPETGLISIVGESGSGKTTLLNILSGFDEQTSGDVFIKGQNTKTFDKQRWNYFHSVEAGFVFQEYNVIEKMSVYENTILPLQILNINNEKKDVMVKDSLSKVGLLDFCDKKVNQLSGGQKQRVAIARAYVKKPKIILADEPTGNLDGENSKKIFELLKSISESTLIIVITHNVVLAKEYSDIVITLEDGKIISDIKTEGEEYVYNLREKNVVITEKDFIKLKDYLRCDNKNNVEEFIIEVKKSNIVKKERLKAKEKLEYTNIGLSLKNIKRLARKILEKRKVRKTVTMLSFGLTVFLLCFVVACINYDENKVISKYMETYNDKFVLVEKKLDSIYKNNDEGTDAYVTEEMKKEISIIADEECTFFQYDEMMFTDGNNVVNAQCQDSKENNFSTMVAARVISDKIAENYYDCNSLSENEFLVTDYLAEQLGLNESDYGNEYKINDLTIIFKGIVNTDYKNKKVNNKSYGISDEKQYINNNKYKVIYLSKDITEINLKQKFRESINIKGNCFYEKSLYGYINKSIEIMGNIKKREIIFGREPKKNNEIVISYDLALQCGLEKGKEKEYIGKSFSLKNIYSKQYGNAFSEYLNLYKYCGDKIVVVGLGNIESDICLEKTCYQNIVTEYYNLYTYDKMGFYSNNWKNKITKIHNNKMKVIDPSLRNVYLIVRLKPTIIKYMIVIMIIMILLTVFLMISFISYSIKDNSKTIGILKSLGINEKDIKKVFIIEPMVIVGWALVIALILLIISLKFANIEVARVMEYRSYDIIETKWGYIVLVEMLTFILGIISAWIPIKLMNEQTIIKTIRGNV